MIGRLGCLNSIVVSMFFSTRLVCAAPENIEHILVTSRDSAFPMSADTSQLFTDWSIATLSTPAKMNPYNIIQFSPSVNFTPVDIAGSNEPSFHDPIRIRGKSQSGPGGVYLINGAAISSNPGGGKQTVDMENVNSIDLYKGYIPSDKNNGFSSLIGKIDINLRPPENNKQFAMGLSMGVDDFSRVFVRADTGEFAETGLFFSVSNLQSQKYKGEGELDRVNLMLGLKSQVTENTQFSFYAIHNKDEHHNYRSYLYSEVNDRMIYASDFAAHRSDENNDVDYFDWNKQAFNTSIYIADFSSLVSGNNTLSINTYYKKDWGEYWNSQTNTDETKNRVVLWNIDHDLFGSTFSLTHPFSEHAAIEIGYWYHRQQPPGPPTNRQKYRVEEGVLVFDGYAVLAEAASHELKSPFLEYSGIWKKMEFVAGIKYQMFSFGQFDSYTYNTNASVSPSYNIAIAETAIDAWSSVGTNKQSAWLPSLYISYLTESDLTLYSSYTRTYGFDVNILPTYIKKRSQFVTREISLQQLWDDTHVETSDNLDIGFLFSVNDLIVQPSLYYANVKNKQANIYDSSLDISYPANIGKARAYGAELSLSGELTNQLTVISGISYNRYAFTENFHSSAENIIATKNKQVPDAPQVMAKGALSYSNDNWTFTPAIRYSSSRYGDLHNIQRIDPYFVTDLDICYSPDWGRRFDGVQFKMSISNLFDRHYISTIIAADNVLSASGTASTYQPGAPRQIYASVSIAL